MTAPRVFLIESLDAAGTALADARARLEALECAGFSARAVAVDLGPEHVLRREEVEGGRGRVALIRERGQLLAALAASRAELVLVASAERGGGIAARWLTPGLTARWWPTGIHPRDNAEAAVRRPGDAALPCLTGAHAGEALDPGPTAGLDWSVLDGPRAKRARLSLWDGDYVLVPAPLTGRAGEETLRAFAAVAKDRTALDLVVLAHPQLEFAEFARRLGMGARVHFAGPAPREAEFAWTAAASAAVLGTAEPISGGLVLRALGSGCPLLPAGPDGASRLLRGWLERRGLLAAAPDALPGGAALELERMLERDTAVEQALARGQAIAALQRVDVFAPRLAAALAAPADGRSEAA
jgi:hypothetical protein